MKIVIVEDEHLAASKLEKMILKYDSNIEVLQKLDSVSSTVRWLKNNPLPDLLLLDIQLTDGSCFDVLKQVKIDCPVIFTTAYDQYALDAFKMQSIDYLIKPISQEKLNKAIDKLMAMKTNLSSGAGVINQLLEKVSEIKKNYKSRFLVKTGSMMRSLNVSDIAFFYSEDKLVFLRTKEDARFVINETLDELENQLNPEDFFRINRQYLVNYNTIQKVHPHFNGRLKIELIPTPREDIYISNRRATSFKAWMNK